MLWPRSRNSEIGGGLVSEKSPQWIPIGRNNFVGARLTYSSAIARLDVEFVKEDKLTRAFDLTNGLLLP